MPIDPRIALGVNPLQFQQQDPNAGMNALARAMQIKSAMQESDVNALKMQELQRGVDETNRLNSIYGGAVGPDGTIDRNKLFGGLATGNLGSKIPGIQKQLLEADTAQATLKKTQTDTQKSELETALKKMEHVGSVLSLAKDPQSYATVRAVIKNQFGQDLPEQFDPAAVQAMIVQGQTLTQRLSAEQQRQELALKTANEAFTVGADGRPVPNAPVQQFQLGKARAGATNVSVSTEKGYAGEMAQGLAKQDLAALDAARGAPERIANAQRVKQILDTQPTITGSGAETRLAVSKALSTAGLIDGQAVKSTEDLASLLASSTLDAIKTSGLGSGQGFTDKDRQFLERAKSGNIEINAGTLRTLADLNEKAARGSIDAGAKVAGRLKGNPSFGSVGQDITTTQPPEYKPRPSSVVRKPGAVAPGVRFLGFEEQK